MIRVFLTRLHLPPGPCVSKRRGHVPLVGSNPHLVSANWTEPLMHQIQEHTADSDSAEHLVSWHKRLNGLCLCLWTTLVWQMLHLVELGPPQ